MKERLLFGIATIILALGFLVRSFQPAIALNTSSVSLGSNPLISFAGKGNSTLVTVPLDRDLVLTDFDFCNTNGGNYGHHHIYLKDTSGNVYGQWWLRKSSSAFVSLSISKQSGLLIPAGTELIFDEGGSTNVTYTISGYYVQP